MTRATLWIVLLYVAVATLHATPQGDPESPIESKASVGGTVISAKTGEPLRGARVTLQPNGGGRRRQDRKQTTTDLNGQFLLRQLAAGQYALQAEKTGYETRRDTRIGQLKLAQDESKTKLVIPLRPAAVITGRILDSYGEPLAGAHVAALHRNFQPGSQEWNIVQIATTDDLGEYRLYGLGMGNYIVGVSPPQEPSQVGAFIFEQLPAFYPGVPTPEEAAPLKVKWGAELEAIDMKLAPAPATVVSGLLAEADTGEALMGFLTIETDDGVQLGNFQTTEDGRFALYGLPSTNLTISGMSRSDRQMHMARGKVRPSESGVEELELLVRSGGPLSGKVVLENPPEESEQVDANESDSEPRTSILQLHTTAGRRFSRPSRARIPIEGGPFEMQDVQPGEYRVEVYPPPGAYLRAIARSGKSLEGFTIEVPHDSTITDLELHFAFDGATISGTVKEGAFGLDGFNADARIIIVSDEPEKNSARTSSQIAEDGSFDLLAMPPGGYTLFAVENRSALDLWDPDVQRAFRASGEHVSLDKKGSATVELTVIKEPDEPL